MEERVLLQSNCSLYRVTTKNELDSFCCGDEDLDDFFHQEACLYDGQLLGKTYLGFCYLIIRLVAVLLWLMPITRKMYYVFMEKMASNSCTQQKN